MLQDRNADVEWAKISFVKARVLAGLEDQQTERAIADGLSVAHSTVRSHVEELKAIRGVRELGKWWRQYRLAWATWCMRQAGIMPDEGETPQRVG